MLSDYTTSYQIPTARLYGVDVHATADSVQIFNVCGIGPHPVSGAIAARELMANAIQRARAGQLKAVIG